MIDVNDEHPSNTEFPIDVTLDEMMIDVNDEHPSNTESPIEVIWKSVLLNLKGSFRIISIGDP